jgi:hypothetical protein
MPKQQFFSFSSASHVSGVNDIITINTLLNAIKRNDTGFKLGKRRIEQAKAISINLFAISLEQRSFSN